LAQALTADIIRFQAQLTPLSNVRIYFKEKKMQKLAANLSSYYYSPYYLSEWFNN